MRDHVLPSALPGILTGTILGLSRAIGETAPLLMVGAQRAHFCRCREVRLTVIPRCRSIYNYARQPDPKFQPVAAGGILILVTILLLMNAAAIVIRSRFRRYH